MKASPREEGPSSIVQPRQGIPRSSGSRCQSTGVICAVSGVVSPGQGYRGVVMGLPPTLANESRPRRHPREGGGPFSVRKTMDSRLRGNDRNPGGVVTRRGQHPKGTTEKFVGATRGCCHNLGRDAGFRPALEPSGCGRYAQVKTAPTRWTKGSGTRKDVKIGGTNPRSLLESTKTRKTKLK